MGTKSYTDMDMFEKALKNAYNGLNEAIAESVAKQTIPLCNAIRLRVSGTGKNADDTAFSTPYSKSHARKRRLYGNGTLGTQIGYKGFYYQGILWQNFKRIALRTEPNRVVATLGFTGSNKYLSNSKLNEIHSAKEGIAIAKPNRDESVDFVRKIGYDIAQYLENIL